MGSVGETIQLSRSLLGISDDFACHHRGALGQFTGGGVAVVEVGLETRLFGLVIPNQRGTSESPVDIFKYLGWDPHHVTQDVWCGAQEIRIWKKLLNKFCGVLWLKIPERGGDCNSLLLM